MRPVTLFEMDEIMERLRIAQQEVKIRQQLRAQFPSYRPAMFDTVERF